MFKLRVVQAGFGDSLLLEFGAAGDPHFILIDGGTAAIYKKYLKRELVKIAAAGRALDLVVASHVDNDHIVGLTAFTSELRASAEDERFISFGGLWHNSFERAVDRSGSIGHDLERLLAPRVASMAAGGAALLGIKEGNKLRVDTRNLGVPMNAGFADDLVTAETAPASLHFENVDFTVVGPTDANLRALEAEWQAWLEENEDVLTEADPTALSKLDESVPNLSSIMLLAEADQKTMLLTGDGRGDHLIDGLRQAGLLAEGGVFHTDLLKMPHHGSDANVTRDFFDVVTADTYVFSANGRYGNPDLATLIWLVEAAKRQQREIAIFVTNETTATKALLRDYPADEYGYTMQIMDANASSEVITLAE